MTVDERSRHALYLRLEEVLGTEEAEVLMEHLPPVGWADVATKRDLDHLADRFDSKLDATEQRVLATLRQEVMIQITNQTRTLMVMFSTILLSVAGIAFAAAKIA